MPHQYIYSDHHTTGCISNLIFWRRTGPDAIKPFLCWANFFCSNLCSPPIKYEYFLIWEYSQT
jgi:hypothetical protein